MKKTEIKNKQRFVTLAIAAVMLSAISASGCAGPRRKAERICQLRSGNTEFVCDTEFAPSPSGACRPGDAEKEKFLYIMTSVSLELLYLDSEPGGRPPFQYRNAPAVFRDIRIESCRKKQGNCLCRMSYRHDNLQEIFYDSAGCRRRSRYSSENLYFRARGCRY